MTREETIAWLKSRGLEPVRHSSRIFIHPDRQNCRYVAMEKVLRFELLSDSLANHWTMVRHGYYGELSISPETGKLRGMKPWHL